MSAFSPLSAFSPRFMDNHVIYVVHPLVTHAIIVLFIIITVSVVAYVRGTATTIAICLLLLAFLIMGR